MRTEKQMVAIVTQATKDLHLDLVRKSEIPSDVIAGSTFGLGVTMMFESGCSEEQIVEIVRRIVGDLTSPTRGAS